MSQATVSFVNASIKPEIGDHHRQLDLSASMLSNCIMRFFCDLLSWKLTTSWVDALCDSVYTQNIFKSYWFICILKESLLILIVNKGPNIVKLRLKLNTKSQLSEWDWYRTTNPPAHLKLKQKKGQAKVRLVSVEVQVRVRWKSGWSEGEWRTIF